MKVEMRRFLYSGVLEFKAVCLWKVCIKVFHKDREMLPFFLSA